MDHNDSQWVDRRLHSLDPPAAWQPDTDAAFARFRALSRPAARNRRAWFALAFAAVAACAAVALISSVPRASMPLLPVSPLTPAHATASFREIGSPKAPIVAEIYSDYECPPCASLFRETVPRLTVDYVEPGKVRLVHRDFPLARHRYAREAARYANAAGRIGRYDAAVTQIFRTQQQWSSNGDIDSQLAPALSAAEMERVRDVLRNSPDLDASVDRDVGQGRADGLRETPSMVVVANGKRHTLGPVPPYPALKSYLDDLLSRACQESGALQTC